MHPLAIYVICATVLLALSILVYLNRYFATRKCHACGAQVELGRSKCQACTYRFIN
jgi:transposase